MEDKLNTLANRFTLKYVEDGTVIVGQRLSNVLRWDVRGNGLKFDREHSSPISTPFLAAVSLAAARWHRRNKPTTRPIVSAACGAKKQARADFEGNYPWG